MALQVGPGQLLRVGCDRRQLGRREHQRRYGEAGLRLVGLLERRLDLGPRAQLGGQQHVAGVDVGLHVGATGGLGRRDDVGLRELPVRPEVDRPQERYVRRHARPVCQRAGTAAAARFADRPSAPAFSLRCSAARIAARVVATPAHCRTRAIAARRAPAGSCADRRAVVAGRVPSAGSTAGPRRLVRTRTARRSTGRTRRTRTASGTPTCAPTASTSAIAAGWNVSGSRKSGTNDAAHVVPRVVEQVRDLVLVRRRCAELGGGLEVVRGVGTRPPVGHEAPAEDPVDPGPDLAPASRPARARRRRRRRRTGTARTRSRARSPRPRAPGPDRRGR